MGTTQINLIKKSILYMSEIFDRIMNRLGSYDIEIIKSVLTDCYEGLASIKFVIANLYSDETVVEEKIQDVIYQLDRLRDGISRGCSTCRRDELEQIYITIRELQEAIEVVLKKEIVFLPYKSSMWDSLESVWRAAIKDSNSVVKVIPIPYFDKDKNGNLGKMHWEGEQFPDYVTITHYEEYDLKEHHPDIVFIHNPYDEYNIVTSVHPDYYSSKLKDLTDKLVYIPYFILEEIDPNNKAAVEERKHYCLTAAVQNADYVIVQSEDMRQIYVNVLSEHVGEQTRSKWEKKILGLGSPKIDKVILSNKENVTIPVEWERCIQKKDGTRKKVVFYNTSIGPFLRSHNVMLDKIESVLSFFKDNSDEMTLIWRPHPLYLSTIEAMHPEQTDRYLEIVKKFKEESWGIYDESADMYTAIAVSDVYYGDGSSVARLYEKTGKKVMYQNPGLR